MPPPDRNRLTAWYLLIKDEWLPTQRHKFGEWWVAVREEPRLLWNTPQFVYSLIGLGVIIAIVVVAWLTDFVAPPPPSDARDKATTANFHVVCSQPECLHHFMIEREFGFDDFPVECPRCKQDTGQQGQRCRSNTCRGRYVPTIEKDGHIHCRICDATLGPAP